MLYAIHGDQTSVEHLENALRLDLQEFIDPYGQDPHESNKALRELAWAAINLDLILETSKYKMQIVFDDECTGEAFNFALRDVDKAPGEQKMMNIGRDIAISGTNVDVVVVPMLKLMGKESYLHETAMLHPNELGVREYDFCNILCPAMVVAGCTFGESQLSQGFFTRNTDTDEICHDQTTMAAQKKS